MHCEDGRVEGEAVGEAQLDEAPLLTYFMKLRNGKNHRPGPRPVHG